MAYILPSTLKQLLEDFEVTSTLLQTLIQFNDLEINNRIKDLIVLITGKAKEIEAKLSNQNELKKMKASEKLQIQSEMEEREATRKLFAAHFHKVLGMIVELT